MNNTYEIRHPNTGKKLTERTRGKYIDYADCIDDDFSIYDGDDLIYDELDIFTESEREEYLKEEEIYQKFSSLLSQTGYRYYYNTYNEAYDINLKYSE